MPDCNPKPPKLDCSMNCKTSAILQELESDDELPDVYNDATNLPAYLIDDRFDDVKFAWIDHNQTNEYAPSKIHGEIKHSEKMYMKGMLKHQDLYCLKSIETIICSNTLIWFANFLIQKDLQSHYKFLRSCLVNDLLSPVLMTKKDTYELGDDKKMEIVII